MTATTRSILLVTHTGRANVVDFAGQVARQLRAAGFEVRALAGEAGELHTHGVREVPADERAAADTEIVLVLGGDGTFLRAAEVAHPVGAPLLGVNLGRVGFLEDIEPDALDDTVRHIVERTYEVEQRLTLDVDVLIDGQVVDSSWALNEVSVEKTLRERVLEVVIEVDDRPLTSFGGDGVLCSTPTGSTAYAFSAGGPVVWPEVAALLVVPNCAHALFDRPLVVAPESVIGVRIAERGHHALVFCDGRRSIHVPAGGRVLVRRGRRPVHVVRIHPRPFTDQLVVKFQLPVQGFRDHNG